MIFASLVEFQSLVRAPLFDAKSIYTNEPGHDKKTRMKKNIIKTMELKCQAMYIGEAFIGNGPNAAHINVFNWAIIAGVWVNWEADDADLIYAHN